MRYSISRWLIGKAISVTTYPTQSEKHEAKGLHQKASGQDDKVIILTIAHLPDEDDPAWPSKSGQAD